MLDLSLHPYSGAPSTSPYHVQQQLKRSRIQEPYGVHDLQRKIFSHLCFIWECRDVLSVEDLKGAGFTICGGRSIFSAHPPFPDNTKGIYQPTKSQQDRSASNNNNKAESAKLGGVQQPLKSPSINDGCPKLHGCRGSGHVPILYCFKQQKLSWPDLRRFLNIPAKIQYIR